MASQATMSPPNLVSTTIEYWGIVQDDFNPFWTADLTTYSSRTGSRSPLQRSAEEIQSLRRRLYQSMPRQQPARQLFDPSRPSSFAYDEGQAIAARIRAMAIWFAYLDVPYVAIDRYLLPTELSQARGSYATDGTVKKYRDFNGDFQKLPVYFALHGVQNVYKDTHFGPLIKASTEQQRHALWRTLFAKDPFFSAYLMLLVVDRGVDLDWIYHPASGPDAIEFRHFIVALFVYLCEKTWELIVQPEVDPTGKKHDDCIKSCYEHLRSFRHLSEASHIRQPDMVPVPTVRRGRAGYRKMKRS